jgi:hypothetical protein
MEKDIIEIKDRARRIETRLTKFLESQGFDTQRKLPTCRGNVVSIPSMECSLADIMAAVPSPRVPGLDSIVITHKGTTVAVLSGF